MSYRCPHVTAPLPTTPTAPASSSTTDPPSTLCPITVLRPKTCPSIKVWTQMFSTSSQTSPTLLALNAWSRYIHAFTSFFLLFLKWCCCWSFIFVHKGAISEIVTEGWMFFPCLSFVCFMGLDVSPGDLALIIFHFSPLVLSSCCHTLSLLFNWM